MGKRYTINSEFVFEDCLVTPSAYEGVLQRFDEFVAPYIEHLHTRFQQNKACDDMRGLLSDTERKNIESIAYFHGEDRQRLQKFIGQSDWDDEAILNKLTAQITNEIGEEDGILILDPTSFPKKGKESVGVQRQWCGRLGKKENCQVAIFLAYASRVEFALVDRRLFIPDVWIANKARCDKAGIPKQHQVKKTRHQQALTAMLVCLRQNVSMVEEKSCRISGLQAMTKWGKYRGFAVNCGLKTNRTCLLCRRIF